MNTMTVDFFKAILILSIAFVFMHYTGIRLRNCSPFIKSTTISRVPTNFLFT